MKIVILIKPFDMMQKIYLYQKSEVFYKKDISLDELDNEIAILTQKYDISNIDIAGPKAYTMKIKQNIAINLKNIKINLI